MSKIGVKYSESNEAIKQINKVITALEKEDKYLNEALSKFEDMILAYSKSNELSSKINEILGKVREDKYKLEAFRINLKIYI